jgi:hypothetical protein
MMEKVTSDGVTSIPPRSNRQSQRRTEMSEPQYDMPCGCKANNKDHPYPVFWNEFNGVIQCHKCGSVYRPLHPAPTAELEERAQAAEANFATQFDETRRLQAELEQAKAALRQDQSLYWRGVETQLRAELEQAKLINNAAHDQLAEAYRQNEDLRAGLATAEADTKRLDWLQDHMKLTGTDFPDDIRKATDAYMAAKEKAP